MGIGQFRSMLKRLTEWDYFDPYYFKKINKLDEAEAKRNIPLNKYVAKSVLFLLCVKAVDKMNYS